MRHGIVLSKVRSPQQQAGRLSRCAVLPAGTLQEAGPQRYSKCIPIKSCPSHSGCQANGNFGCPWSRKYPFRGAQELVAGNTGPKCKALPGEPRSQSKDCHASTRAIFTLKNRSAAQPCLLQAGVPGCPLKSPSSAQVAHLCSWGNHHRTIGDGLHSLPASSHAAWGTPGLPYPLPMHLGEGSTLSLLFKTEALLPAERSWGFPMGTGTELHTSGNSSKPRQTLSQEVWERNKNSGPDKRWHLTASGSPGSPEKPARGSAGETHDPGAGPTLTWRQPIVRVRAERPL